MNKRKYTKPTLECFLLEIEEGIAESSKVTVGDGANSLTVEDWTEVRDEQSFNLD